VIRRAITTTTAAVLVLGLAAGCSPDDAAETIVERASDGKVEVDDDGKQITVKGENGEGTFSIGEEAELPDDFPEDDVPLPDGGSVRAAVSSEQGDRQVFSITYAIDGDLASAADDYADQLADDGYEIDGQSSISSAGGNFTSFTAVGTEWDVRVFAAGGQDDAALSIQVSTHDASTTP
jgi:hypothetical protein